MPQRRAPFEFFAGMRQHGDRRDRGIKGRPEMRLQFLQRNVRQHLGVKLPVGQPEAPAETLAVERRES
jgi:hypothetical protein